MQLKVSPGIKNWVEIKNRLGRGDECNVGSLWNPVQQQGFKVELARKDAYPSFTVGPCFFQKRAGDRENQFGIGISMPLPLWNRNEGNIETAMARQKQAETSMYVTQRTIERQVVEKVLTYRTKLAEMNKWRPESVAEFRKAAALADRHLPAGRPSDRNLCRTAETIP